MRHFERYENREDYKNGLYVIRPLQNEMIQKSFNILGNEDECLKAMSSVLEKWTTSCKVNLTNKSKNRIAWLGQSCCCLSVGATEDEVKSAWKLLNDDQKEKANKIADLLIKEREGKNI